MVCDEIDCHVKGGCDDLVTDTVGDKSTPPQLKEHLVDELDYVLLPAEAWNKMVSWYSMAEGQVSGRPTEVEVESCLV